MPGCVDGDESACAQSSVSTHRCGQPGNEQPVSSKRVAIEHYPDLSILVACYNEAESIAKTIASLALQKYPGRMDILILDDGSTDGTLHAAHAAVRGATLAPGHFRRR